MNYPKMPLAKRTPSNLLTELQLWQDLTLSALFYANPSNIEWLLPLARKNADHIVEELTRRYRPRLLAYSGGAGLKERLQADDVQRSTDKRLIYYYFLLDAEERRDHIYARCPFHKSGQERTPSFSARVDNGIWYCHGCQAKGSVFTFVMRMENLDFQTALERVNAIGRGKAA